jgi:bilirubin oxidase
MVDIQVLSRAKGRKSVQPWEKVAMKDIIVLGPNEQVTVRVKFAPYNGLYMFHCHNLIHEDHAMMAAFNITDLSDMGYSGADLAFTDPMEGKWRAQPYMDTQISSLQSEILPKFAATQAYANVTGLQSKLDAYWSTHSDQATRNSASGVSEDMKFLLYRRYIPVVVSLLMMIWW